MYKVGSQKEYDRQRAESRRSRGLCVRCGKPSNGAFRCAECKQRRKTPVFLTEEERFMKYVDEQPSGCWLWTGSAKKYDSGLLYGQFRYKGKSIKASRAAYSMFVAPIPAGAYIRHTCDMSMCVNPAHLVSGTHADNMRDMAERGRSPRGERHHNSKLTESSVREIRSLYKDGWLQRELAAFYGVNVMAVSKVLRGETWSHVT